LRPSLPKVAAVGGDTDKVFGEVLETLGDDVDDAFGFLEVAGDE